MATAIYPMGVNMRLAADGFMAREHDLREFVLRGLAAKSSALALAIGLVVSLPIPANAQLLAGKELKSLVSGKRIYLKVPLGGEFPLFYSAVGKVDGSGEAAGLGRFLKPNDTGRWWVEGQKLCQIWQTWYDGKQFCFTIEKTGETSITWTRDDGYSGTARIGD